MKVSVKIIRSYEIEVEAQSLWAAESAVLAMSPGEIQKNGKHVGSDIEFNGRIID
jgi:hypothetical protein